MTCKSEDIIKEYKKLRSRIGQPPDSKAFYEKTDVTKNDAEVAFGSQAFSKIQKAAGDTPNVFGRQGRSPDEFFGIYGKVIRDLQKTPTIPDWKHLKMNPTATSYCRKLELRWSDMPSAFLNWAVDKPEWQDVARKCSSCCPRENQDGHEISSERVGYVYLMKSGPFYTIGKSDHIGRRSYEHERKLPKKIKIVHTIKTDDPFGVERYWENRFMNKKIETEGSWYKLNANDIRSFKRWKKIF